MCSTDCELMQLALVYMLLVLLFFIRLSEHNYAVIIIQTSVYIVEPSDSVDITSG